MLPSRPSSVTDLLFLVGICLSGSSQAWSELKQPWGGQGAVSPEEYPFLHRTWLCEKSLEAPYRHLHAHQRYAVPDGVRF